MNLTSKSKQLMLFFSKNKYFFDMNQSNKTKKILLELYGEILEAHYYVKKNLPHIISIKKILSPSQIIKPKNFNANSFPEKVRNHIDEMIVSEISYSFSLYDRDIKVYFMLESDNVELELEKYNNYVETIAMWMYILNIYASKQCVKSLSIYLYLTSLEKHLPNSNISVLDENHVNTAFTTTCPSDSEIIVFRKEEWFKVLIHETFHNFGLDFSGMNNDTIRNCILDIFDVNSEVNAFEAYTEFWAEIMNAVFCSFYSLKEKQDINDFLSNVEFYINFERTYTFFQLIKTLQFMGLKYQDLYSKTDQAKINRENLYKERTNVLSYYVIKAVLMNNYQTFLTWCRTNNFSLLDFKKTLGNQKSFCDYIKKNYKCQSMLKNIHETEILLSKTKRKKGNYKYILSNMRMSICELG
jgi:hypothetical protein